MPHAVQQQRGAVHGVDVGVPSTPRPSQRLHLAPRPAQMEDGETAMPTPLLEKFQITRHANNVCFLFDVLAPFLLLLSYIMQCMTKHVFCHSSHPCSLMPSIKDLTHWKRKKMTRMSPSQRNSEKPVLQEATRKSPEGLLMTGEV